MRRSSWPAIALAISLCGCASIPAPSSIAGTTTPNVPVHLAEAALLDLRMGEETYYGVITLPLEDQRTVLNLGDGRDPVSVCVVEGDRETCVTAYPDQPQDLVIRFGGEEKTLVLSYLGPQASFPAAYRAAHRGTLDIEVAPAYELVNVAIALTSYAKENPGLAAPSPYLDGIRADFAKQANHPAVQALDAAMRKDGSAYHSLKMNGAAFVLAEDDGLSRSPIYKSTGWGENDLLPFMDDLQDFARATGFSQYYAKHLPLYTSQIEYLRNEVNVDDMIVWLGTEFPEVTPYDHTRIMFSPLVGYNQSVSTFDADGFRQLMPHVNFPYPSKDDAELTPEALKVYRGLILFTELNHGYINPTIDAYSSELQEAMPQLSNWAGDETARGYGNASGIFTEMTNWALVSVRAYDLLPESEAEVISKRVAHIMVRNRGFTRFAEFQQQFLALSRGREKGVPVAHLLPALIETLPAIASK